MPLTSREFGWVSSFYGSEEKCTLVTGGQGIVITSVITGCHETVPYEVEYLIKTTLDWRVTSFELTCVRNGTRQTVSAAHTGGNWVVNEQIRTEFNACTDIDITLTPFTNSLPINRLSFQPGKPQQLDVLYVDVLNHDMRVARQQYTKKSAGEYNFQNVPNDFEADIVVDPKGFVVHYPGLFERIND
jgi:hypothetical protein